MQYERDVKTAEKTNYLQNSLPMVLFVLFFAG